MRGSRGVQDPPPAKFKSLKINYKNYQKYCSEHPPAKSNNPHWKFFFLNPCIHTMYINFILNKLPRTQSYLMRLYLLRWESFWVYHSLWPPDPPPPSPLYMYRSRILKLIILTQCTTRDALDTCPWASVARCIVILSTCVMMFIFVKW